MKNTGSKKKTAEREDLIALLSARALQGTQRIEKTSVGDNSYWIKRHHVDGLTFIKKLHGAYSKITRKEFLRSSPIVSMKEVTQREIRKYNQFSTAGIYVPKIIWSNETILVIEDASPTIATLIEQSKQQNNNELVDELLLKFGFALSDAHGLGLCHGRPHTRDTVIFKGQTGFIDFEEEPEAVMPLEMAHARDLWLAMLHICSRASNFAIPLQIFDYWSEKVSDEAINALQIYNNYFMPILRVAQKVPPKYRGNDLKRGMAATDFIDKAFAEITK